LACEFAQPGVGLVTRDKQPKLDVACSAARAIAPQAIKCLARTPRELAVHAVARGRGRNTCSTSECGSIRLHGEKAKGDRIVPTLLELVPDVDALLNMDPEDLGIELLRVFSDSKNTQNGMIHLSHLESLILRDG
jgi:hypothetical protein